MRPYTWRQAIQKSKLPSTTKFVLLNLACYINDAGQAAFPSIDQQAQDTGLSRRAVITHLKSVEGRWLSVTKHGYGGQKWARNEYLPRLPDEPDLDVKGLPTPAFNAADVGEEGGERRSPPSAQNCGKGGERGSPPFSLEGGERDDRKAVNVVHSNRPVEQTNKNTSPRAGGSLLAMPGDFLRRWFEELFWPKYPKRVGKADAMAALENLKPDGAMLDAIVLGLDQRVAAERHAKAKGLFFPAWPDPHRWLRKRRWLDEVPRETNSGVPRCHCGAVGVVGDGRRWYCPTHNPDRRPS